MKITRSTSGPNGQARGSLRSGRSLTGEPGVPVRGRYEGLITGSALALGDFDGGHGIGGLVWVGYYVPAGSKDDSTIGYINKTELQEGEARVGQLLHLVKRQHSLLLAGRGGWLVFCGSGGGQVLSVFRLDSQVAPPDIDLP